MGSSRRIRWLEQELEHMVDEGVLEGDAAARVRSRLSAPASWRSGFPVFAVLGALLLGLGIIVLLGHNWELLPRGARAGLCVSLLLGAQGIAGYALLRRTGSVAWSESGALFLVLSVGAALALIGQTYHVPGDLRGFLVQWMLLALPVVYALDSRGSAALYLVLAGSWLGSALAAEVETWIFWLLLGGLAPYLHTLSSRADAPYRNGLVGWLAVPVLLFGVAGNAGLQHGTLIFLALTLALAGLHAQGTLASEKAASPPFYAAAARQLGAFGIASLVLVFSLGLGWELVTLELDGASAADALPGVAVALGLGALAGRGGLRALREDGEWPRALAATLPLVFALCLLASLELDSRALAAVLMSLYGLALGVGTLLGGVREGSVARANAGMLLAGGVIFARFVDVEWSFTVRGIVFIAMGAAFLLLNLKLRRTPRRHEAAA